MAIKVDKLLITHLVLPLLALSVVSIVILMGDIDRIVADYIYAAQGNTWVWKNHWLMESVFHKGGRNLSLLLALIVIVLLCISCVHHSLAPYKKSLLYLVLATAGSSLLVSFFKSSLAVSCPWEFARYGGSLDYHTVLEQLFLRNGEGCFPAGHASAGYAWISLYFIGIHYQSRWRWVGLIISLLAGLLFGIAQQLRGAHFISHDLWTLAICWLISLSLFLVFFRSSTNRQLLLEPLCP